MKTYTRIQYIVAAILLLIICNIVNITVLNAESPKWLHVMPGNIVTSYAEDGENMWLTTSNSTIYKFHLASNLITDSIKFKGDFLEYDKSGNLWIANQKGLAKYKDNILTNYSDSIYNNNKFKEIGITSIKTDNQGNLWLGTFGSGIYKFDGKSLVNYDMINAGLPTNSSFFVIPLNSIDYDKNNNMWFGFTYGGVAKFDGTNWSFYTDTNSVLPTNNINDLKADKSGNIWISTLEGLIKIDGQNWTTYKNENTELPIYNYGKMSFDNFGNIWFIITKENGVAKFDGNNFEVLNMKNSELKANAIYTIYIDSKNNKWFTVVNGENGYRGIDIYNEDGVIPTSVNESNQDLSGINAYPNPASDFIMIDPKITDNVNIYNILGLDITPENISGKFDISKFQSGTYFIKIGNKIEKFVKL